MPSSVIRRFHYRRELQELEVEFTSGRRYVYFRVPPREVSGLEAAESLGKYFNAHIRDHYDYREIEQARR